MVPEGDEIQNLLGEDELNDYRLKPVGFVVNRERRTVVFCSRFRNLKIAATIVGLGPVLQACSSHYLT